MIARDFSLANQLARTTLADVAVVHLLAAAVAADPAKGAALIDAIAADIKAAGDAYQKAARSTRNAGLHRLAEALMPALDAVTKEIEALKPKV